MDGWMDGRMIDCLNTDITLDEDNQSIGAITLHNMYYVCKKKKRNKNSFSRAAYPVPQLGHFSSRCTGSNFRKVQFSDQKSKWTIVNTGGNRVHDWQMCRLVDRRLTHH